MSGLKGEPISHFDEKGGIIVSKTSWGRWWQTVYEIHIEVDLPPNTRGKNCSVIVKPSYIECTVLGNTLFKGTLYGVVRSDDHVWTIEGGVLTILLSRVDHVGMRDMTWASLLKDNDEYELDAWTLHETRKKLDLERFQIENPGFDFSNAKLAKGYDKVKPLAKDMPTYDDEDDS